MATIVSLFEFQPLQMKKSAVVMREHETKIENTMKGNELEEAVIVRSSPFENTCGSLDLVKTQTGEIYLKIMNFSRRRYVGPLTQQQIERFNTVCEAVQVNVDYELNV